MSEMVHKNKVVFKNVTKKTLHKEQRTCCYWALNLIGMNLFNNTLKSY